MEGGFELCRDLEEGQAVLERAGAGRRVSFARIRGYSELVEELDAELRDYLAIHTPATPGRER